MSADITVVPGLGRPFTLGMLYDARHEKLIPGFSLFGDETLQQYESTNPQRSSEFQIVASDSIESKSTLMDIEASLGVSFMGGLVEVGGSAKYLNNSKKYQNQSRVTLKYKATTTYKQFTATPGTVKVQETIITNKRLATHVVTGILYGANAFFVFDSDKVEENKLQDIQGKMEAVIKKIPTVSIEGYGSVKLTDEEKSLASNLTCKFHGDFILESLPTTFEDAVMTYQKLPGLLGEDGADSVPMKVWLVPLEKFNSEAQQLIHEISDGIEKKIRGALEELYQLKRKSREAMDDKVAKQFPLIHDKVSNFNQILHDYILSLQHTIAKKLPEIRGGSDESSIEKLIADRAKSPFSDDNLRMWLTIIDREIRVIGACTGMMKGTHTRFVSNQTELDREVLAADAKHGLCFVFTSLERSDPYLKVLSNFLESPDSGSTKDVGLSTQDRWCFSSRVTIQMKQKAKVFAEIAKNMKDSRSVRFLVAAISNPKCQGASIYHYQEGSLVTYDFTFPRMSSVEGVKDRRELLWHACDLTFDPNTANVLLTLSDNNKHVESGKQNPLSSHPEKFDVLPQVLCKEGLNGRHYWEIEWTGYVRAGVAYISIGRKGSLPKCSIGQSFNSWALDHVPRTGYSAKHYQSNINVTAPSPGFKRLGMYLDWRAGSLSYYMVSSNTLRHIYTFRAKFTEPVYPAFRVGSGCDNGKVRLL